MIRQDDLERIHDAAVCLLRDVGCVIHDSETVALLSRHGVRTDGRRIYITEALVADALAAAPSTYTVCGRRPDLDLRIGEGTPPVLGSGSGPAFVLRDGYRHQATLADIRVAIALTHLSPNFAVHGALSMEAPEMPEGRRARVSIHAYVTGSDKAAIANVNTSEELKVALRVAEILHGSEWHLKPRLWTIISPSSPLQFSSEACRALVSLATLGQQICVSVCAMAGTTAPLTLPGLLAVQHAELLAGLVMSQLARPGCPFLYGGTSSVCSMRSGALLIGAPEFWALAEATVQLGHWLHLPVRAGGALTDAHLPDAQAGIESVLGLEAALRLDAQYVHQSAGILSSFGCYSPTKFIIDDEVISALRRARMPLEVDEESLAIDVMASAGPGGNFLGQPHTKHHVRDHEWATIMNRDPYETWLQGGALDLAALATKRVDAMLESYRPPDDLDRIVRHQLDECCLA